MAYIPFDNSKPNFADDGDVVVDSIHDNLMALRDAMIAGGALLFNFDLVISGGTAEQPATFVYTHKVNTNIKVKKVLTWGTTGGSANNVTSAALSYSVDSGAIYDPIGTFTWSYDVNGNVTGALWS